MPLGMKASIKGARRKVKEKIRIVIFPPNERPAPFPVRRNIGNRLKVFEQARY
jgi:hypothetical protein